MNDSKPATMDEDEQEPCPKCGDGEYVPDCYYRCPVCDAEWEALETFEL